MLLNPYLFFKGDCEAAFKFYERALRGTGLTMHTYGTAPADMKIAPEWGDKIMHARLTVGDQALMGSDAPPDRQQSAGGFSVSISVDEPAEAERIFRELAEGGSQTMPIGETFWAKRFGMLVDRFGIPWMVNCEKPMPQ